MDLDRAGFEAWYIARLRRTGIAATELLKGSNGGYHGALAQFAWEAWQAARRLDEPELQLTPRRPKAGSDGVVTGGMRGRYAHANQGTV